MGSQAAMIGGLGRSTVVGAAQNIVVSAIANKAKMVVLIRIYLFGRMDKLAVLPLHKVFVGLGF